MAHGMRSFGMISTTIWQSEKFIAMNSDQARLGYFWLHTSAKTCAGVLRTGPAHLLEECCSVTTLEQANDVFRELERVGIIQWFRPYVILRGYLTFNPVKTYKHAIGAFKEVLALPDCDAKHSLINQLKTQSGAMKLVKWRSKLGEPHEILFSIEAYLTRESADPVPNLTPSDGVSDPIGNPIGKSRITNTKEKGELGSTETSVDARHGGDAEVQRKRQATMPRAETVALAKRMGTIC